MLTICVADTSSRKRERHDLGIHQCCACSHPRYRGSLWCREHLIEVGYVRDRVTPEMRDRGHMYPEEFIGWYWVDPTTGERISEDLEIDPKTGAPEPGDRISG